jgi:23S rRNA pseudouridine1911/1915/1917 synthase
LAADGPGAGERPGHEATESATSKLTLLVAPDQAGRRLDRWLADAVRDLSRARLQALIDDGRVQVDGRARKAAYRLAGGESVDVEMPPPPSETLTPEPITLSIVFEDDHVIVIDKPAGLVVHPGAGNARGTLAAAVLAHAPSIASVGSPRRPGIVHRLDKGTSGLLALAKTQVAYASLTAQLAARTVTRRYVAVVHGRLVAAEGVVDAPIGRDPHDRLRMTVGPRSGGKRAVTRYRVLERFSHHTSIEAVLETGRTHQIRVHLASIGHPVVGDPVYGRRGEAFTTRVDGVALHAAALAFLHPVTQKRVEFSAPVPPRIERLLAQLRAREGRPGGREWHEA